MRNMAAVTKKQAGDFGEHVTREYLEKLDYAISAVNYHCRYGEIDIIAKNSEFILFVEVKTRGEGLLYRPAEAVTFQKQERLKKTAQLFLCEHPVLLQPRFDVSEVFIRVCQNDIILTDFHYLPNAF